jgi:hypothetical protein
VATFTGGGIDVEGDASVQLSTSGSSAQVYTIKQGSTTTAITIDNTSEYDGGCCWWDHNYRCEGRYRHRRHSL